jgi:histidyl-tRNA synthetase
VILELLADLGRLPELRRQLDAVVFAFSDAQRPQAVRLAAALRAEGHSVELALSGGRLKRALADADRAGARRIYLLGPDEVKQGAALVRDLQTGEQTTCPLPR